MLQEELNMYFEEYESDLSKVLTHLKDEFTSIRAGRANPRILDKIMVDYYGQMTPLNQMANISAPEPRLLVISLWDASAIKSAVKAINESELGLAPSDDGKVIRLAFPILTSERRQELVKNVKTLNEQAKVAMRNLRRDILDIIKQAKKDGMSEDECSGYEVKIQKILDKYTDLVDVASKEKETEITTL